MTAKRPRKHEPLLGKRLVLCMGSGGVGKTSAAAALAYAAALDGRRCGLITVDPARRLRSALGLEDLSPEPTRIEIDAPGELHAMALDTKRVFDDLIERAAPSPDIASRILANPLYQELSNELGGSTEYMAMEKLHEILADDYDLIVVDTPPSAHAGDLLGAPVRITDLIDSGAAAVLRSPASILRGNRLASATVGAALKILERWIGTSLVGNLADFAGAFEPLLAGFRQRADDVQLILRDKKTAAVIVTTPETPAIRTASELYADLCSNRLRVAGIVANQVNRALPLRKNHHLRCSPALRESLIENHEDYRQRARRDRKALREIERDIAPVIANIPRLEQPISSLEHLATMARILLPQIT